MSYHTELSPVRAWSCFLTAVATLAVWAGVTLSFVYGMTHTGDYLHEFNPYLVYGGLGLFPAAVFTVITLFVWADSVSASDRPRPR